VRELERGREGERERGTNGVTQSRVESPRSSHKTMFMTAMVFDITIVSRGKMRA